MKYRKTADADARQVPPLTPGWHEFPPLSLEELADWCGGQKFTNESGDYIVVPALEMRAWPSDWIVKVGPGQFFKVEHEDFAKSFVAVDGTLMSIDHGEIIRRLRSLAGAESADEGFRSLCAAAQICSNCMQPWDANCDCRCTKGTKS